MIYFDNAATTRPSKIATDKVIEMMETNFGNPSSLHNAGFIAEQIVNKARNDISKGLCDGDMIFTSGGTESNNLAVSGTANAYKRTGKHIITTSIEHPSVANVFKFLSENGFSVTYVPSDDNGYVDTEFLLSRITEETTLVSVNHVNSETGTIQDINKIAKSVKEKNCRTVFHSDCVQSFLKLDIDSKYIDLISVSGHKLHAPKGVGALYIKKGVKITPLLFGGNQQNGVRPGTENTPAIAAFAAACTYARENLRRNFDHVSNVKNKLLEITSLLQDVTVNGDDTDGSPYILSLIFKDVKGEVLLHALEAEKIYVSTGSACSERNKKNINKDKNESAVRFSFSYENTVSEAERCLMLLQKLVPNLRKFVRR